MSPVFHASARYWIAGLVLAVVGVVSARLVAPLLPSIPRAIVAFLGQMVALSGLFVIALGIRRRMSIAATSAETESAPRRA